MSAQERWDVVIRVLDGPLAGMGDQVLRGPVVRIGVTPGPGGLALTGYRGLDARHAVITAYDGGTVTIGPVGSNQVRLAPHPNVNWKEIDPVTAPQYMNAGGAIHLGPIGRGATLEFVKAQRLGQWTKGDLASEADKANAAAIKNPAHQQIPVALSANSRRVGVISTQFAPAWFLGCLMLMATAAGSVVLAVGVGWWITRAPDRLGPVVDGEYFADFAEVDRAKLEEFGLLEGLQEPFANMVIRYNVEASGRNELTTDATLWDQNFYDHVAASVYQHAQWKLTWQRFDAIKEDYHTVTKLLQEQDMPEVFAGVPYRESAYHPDLQSNACARGWWQFMPEVAYRIDTETKGEIPIKVSGCHFSDAAGSWSPTEVAPPPGLFKNAKYINPASKSCRITQCDVDRRSDLVISTKAAIYTFKEVWNDPVLRASGALTEIAIASHNAGYDDGRFGLKKKTNLLHAFNGWAKDVPKSKHNTFYGEQITCNNPDDLPKPQKNAEGIALTNNAPPTDNYCGSRLHAETQHYVYPIVARHILAVCYYGKNYSDMPGFADWAKFNAGDHYCTKFAVPTPNELRKK